MGISPWLSFLPSHLLFPPLLNSLPQPLKDRGVAVDLAILTYLVIFGLYWVWTTVHFLVELREMREVRGGGGSGQQTTEHNCHRLLRALLENEVLLNSLA